MKELLLFFLLFGLCTANGQITIDDCQEKAKANYPLIKQYDLIAKSSDYTISNANKAYLPQVSITGIGGYIFAGLPEFSSPGSSSGEPNKAQFIGIAQINQTIWDGGATRTQKDIIKTAAEVEKSSVGVALYSIRERVNQLFFGILLIDEQNKQLDILFEELNRGLKKVRLSKENGLAYASDVDEVKAEMLNLEQKKIEFNYTRKGYVQMLSYLIGQELDENVKLEKPIVIEPSGSLTNNRPELSLYSNQLKLVESRSAINQVVLMPKIGLIGAGALIEPGLNFGSSKFNGLALAGISMSWSTAGLYKSSNNKELDKIEMDKITNQQDVFLFNNKLQLTQANSDIEKQKAIIAKDGEIITLKGNVKKSKQLMYDNGLCSMNDLLSSINKENEAIGNQALHNIQLLMSLYNYKTISGN
ncbi:MAG TPA: TolC family protein [Flavobacterium sp.]|uniref:TolC family protein n=1 Tax=Flavobacterium sp. TaxID=239 RepID=UPI002DB6635A|nr:TolC family protein [Flavobacterium sp.]HEU4788567.1 TolC family protein [Flavobacterium sp.]